MRGIILDYPPQVLWMASAVGGCLSSLRWASALTSRSSVVQQDFHTPMTFACSRYLCKLDVHVVGLQKLPEVLLGVS